MIIEEEVKLVRIQRRRKENNKDQLRNSNNKIAIKKYRDTFWNKSINECTILKSSIDYRRRLKQLNKLWNYMIKCYTNKKKLLVMTK